ncbi:BQ2448_3398 [Microbotryum intermedium]|uniref:BQ2448_3398 protein n=1 Tax=Microbotryum intermedium TaxID=269621 RepID=A0A238FHU2_9BASI|nr:BQ2448_3398 [Microbotryum intermedium]
MLGEVSRAYCYYGLPLGPFEILGPVGTSAYKLVLPRDLRIHDVFHVSFIQIYTPSTVEGLIERLLPVTIIDGDGEHEVEEIFASQARHGSLHGRVRKFPARLSATSPQWILARFLHTRRRRRR